MFLYFIMGTKEVLLEPSFPRFDCIWIVYKVRSLNISKYIRAAPKKKEDGEMSDADFA